MGLHQQTFVLAVLLWDGIDTTEEVRAELDVSEVLEVTEGI